MPVITCASPKGGVGKSTTSVILATEFAHKGIPVVIIDTDPNKAIMRWAELDGLPPNISVEYDHDPDTIMSTIKRHDKDGQVVIIDLEGVASRLNSRAIAKSDLVLVVSKAAQLDADCAGKAARMVMLEEEAANRTIPFAIVFTQVPPGNILSAEVTSVIRGTIDTGVRVIQPFLRNRIHYSNLHTFGGGLRDLGEHKSLPTAIEEAEDFAVSVFECLKETSVGQEVEAAAN